MSTALEETFPKPEDRTHQDIRHGRAYQWVPTLSPDGTFSSGSQWVAFRDAGKLEVLCESALKPESMVEAVADITRSILAMELGSKFNDPRNKRTREFLVRKAPEICDALWRHRTIVCVYEDEPSDEISSARILLRKYVAFMMRICTIEQEEDFQVLLQASAADVWAWCWILCDSNIERDEPSAQLDLAAWSRINPFRLWDHVVQQYLIDFNLAKLTRRLDLLLLCPNFVPLIPQFSVILLVAVRRKLHFPFTIYQQFVDKIVQDLRDSVGRDEKDRYNLVEPFVEIISLAANETPNPTNFLFELYSKTSLHFLLGISFIIAVEAGTEEERRLRLSLVAVTQKCCSPLTSGRELRSVLVKELAADWKGIREILDNQAMARDRGFSPDNVALVKDAALLLGRTLALEDEDNLAHIPNVLSVSEEALVGCSHVQCAFHQDPDCVMKKCTRCGKAQYCNKVCQVKDWKIHKERCRING